MGRHRWWQGAVYGILIGLAASGCGSRIGSGEMAAQATNAALVIDLPALYIDYDHSGEAYVGSVTVATFGSALGINLGQLNLDAAQIAQVMAANIQHVQVTNRPGELLLVVNGRPLPALRWDDDALSTSLEMLHALNLGVVDIAPLLPTMAEFGGGVVLRFPVAAGSSRMPLAVITPTVDKGNAARDAYLAQIGAPPQLRIEVFYKDDGTWQVEGLDAAAWGTLLPLPWQRLNLSAATLAALHTAAIKELTITSDRQGLFVAVNGRQLPHLDWANGELTNLIVLADEGGLFTQLLGDTPTAYSLAAKLERLLPMIQTTEVTLFVHFPATDKLGD
ncbi:MAG: hypothetical protein R2867_31645 [Caldilineaceae bacterium]